MLSVCDRDERAGGLESWVIDVVLDAHVDVELDEKPVDTGLALWGARRCRQHFLAEVVQQFVVLDQYVVGVHRAASLLSSVRHASAKQASVTTDSSSTGCSEVARTSITPPRVLTW